MKKLTGLILAVSLVLSIPAFAGVKEKLETQQKQMKEAIQKAQQQQLQLQASLYSLEIGLRSAIAQYNANEKILSDDKKETKENEDN